jgi:putative DNA primase/helicase
MTSARFLTLALGGRWHGDYGTARCPAHDDRRPSLSIRDGDRGGALVHCFAHCDQLTVIASLKDLGFWFDATRLSESEQERFAKQRRARERERQRRAAFCERVWRKTWAAALPAVNSPIRNWLQMRGIALSSEAVDGLPLRWAPHCPLGRDTAPAMVALMTGAVSGTSCGIHRTFLAPDGGAKAFSENSRMMLGKAGVIRLSPDEVIGAGLGIAEGIETALSIMAVGWRPIWAVGSLEGMRRFPILPGVECLTIFADPKTHEVAGARACADRWAEAGREVILRIPRGGDWNDVLKRWCRERHTRSGL